MLGFESKHQPLLSRRAFAQRLALSFGAAGLLIGLSLLAGMIGYHTLEGMAWIDAFANAAMILSGMGPLTTLHTWGGKLFAGLYALYSGLAVIVVIGSRHGILRDRFRAGESGCGTWPRRRPKRNWLPCGAAPIAARPMAANVGRREP